MFGTQGIRFNEVDSPVLSFFLFSVRPISFSSGGSAVAELEKKNLEEKVAEPSASFGYGLVVFNRLACLS